MTFDAFIAKWTGKPVDFDGVYPNQCMDLMHQYVYDVLGFTDARILAQPAAYQVFTNFNNVFGHELFEKIDNTPTGIPQKGDILFYNKTTNNPYGHVCMFVSGDANKLKSFDANYPTGSLPHIQDHTYGYCLGWLRAKQAATSMVQVDSKVFETLVRKSTTYDKIREKLNVEDSETVVLSEVKKYEGYRDAVVQKDAQLNKATEEITKLQATITALNLEQERLKAENEDQKAAVAQQAITIQEQTGAITDISDKLEKLKTQCNAPQILTGVKRAIYELLLKL